MDVVNTQTLSVILRATGWSDVMSVPSYEVVSLHVASDPNRTVGTNFFFDSFPAPAHMQMPQDYLFWVIRGAGRCMIVDTAFTPDAAHRRGRTMHRSVQSYLHDLQIDAEKVTDLIMTHLHWDHAGNIGLFPNATVHVQADEIAFCTGRAMLHPGVSKIYAVEDIQSAMLPLFEGRMNLIQGDIDICPGIRAIRVGGHTPGSMVLCVSTRRGEIVLASDAAHFWANMQQRAPFPILDSFTDALSAFDRIHGLVEGDLARIMPGHDPLQRSVFPALPGCKGATMLHADPLVNVTSAIENQFRSLEVQLW